MEIEGRSKGQPAPPAVIWEALAGPHRPGSRRWLVLDDGETEPSVLESERPGYVVWSSLWPERPNDRVCFKIEPAGDGSRLTWVLEADEPGPSDGLVGRIRYRINFLVNSELRLSFGQ